MLQFNEHKKIMNAQYYLHKKKLSDKHLAYYTIPYGVRMCSIL